MSRCGYSEDYGEEFNNQAELYRNSVEKALSGKRGQKFLKELLQALDEMPEKKLAQYAFEENGQVCALGSIGRKRGIDMPRGDFSYDDGLSINVDALAKSFGIAPCMAREIMFENDSDFSMREETPEQRFERMHRWIANHITPETTK